MFGFIYLLFGQVIGQVGNHDLGLGRDAISRGAALATLAGRASLGLGLAISVSVVGLVGDVLQRLNLGGCRGILGSRSGALSTSFLLVLRAIVSLAPSL